MTLLQFFLNAIISPIKWRGLFFTYKNGDSWSAFLSRLYVKLHFKKSNNVSHNNPNIVNDVFVVVYQFLEGYNAHVVQKKLYRVNERSPQNPWNQFFKKKKLSKVHTILWHNGMVQFCFYKKHCFNINMFYTISWQKSRKFVTIMPRELFPLANKWNTLHSSK